MNKENEIDTKQTGLSQFLRDEAESMRGLADAFCIDGTEEASPAQVARRLDESANEIDRLTRDLAIEKEQNAIAAEIIQGFLSRFPSPTCREQAVVVELAQEWQENNA